MSQRPDHYVRPMWRRRLVASLCLLSLAIPALAAAPAQFDRYGGWAGLQGKRTGFFHTQKLGGRWWLITPDGNAFFSAGVYCVRISGIPDVRTGRRAYRENCLFAHGSEKEWARVAVRRVGGWGFNTIGDWSSASVITQRQLPYCLSASIKQLGSSVLSVSWSRFPDVFDPKFAEASRAQAAALVRRFSGQLTDPWLLGYFIDDEAGFYGSKNAWGSLVDDYARLPAGAPGKQALVELLQQRYGNIQRLNAAWGARYRSFAELRRATRTQGRIAKADKSTFLELVSARYVAPICKELRRLDPNHLILGPRPSRFYPEVMKGIGRYCDVINVSAYQLNRGHDIDPQFTATVNGIARDSGRPVMLGVLIGARSRTYPTGIVRTQRDRGVSYQRYLQAVCSNPNVVGLHWFQYFDPPAANKQDTGNYGLVTEGDEPYKDCVAVVAEANRNVYRYLLPKAFPAGTPAAPKFEPAPKPTKSIAKPLAITNGDFESKAPAPWQLQAWQGTGRATPSRTQPHGGRQCIRFVGSGPGWDSSLVAVQYAPAIRLKPDHRYRLSVWLRSKGLKTWAGVRLKIKRADGSDGYIQADIKKDAPKWTEAVVEFDNGDERAVSVQYIAVMHVGEGTAWADDVQLRDLGTPPAEPKPAAWPRGIAVPNPGAEQLDSKGHPVGWLLQTWQGNGEARVDRRVRHAGRHSILLRGGSQPGWGSSVAAIQKDPPISFQAGRRYAFSAWIRTEGIEASLHLRIKVKYPDGKDEYIQGVLSADLPAWTEVRKEFVLPRDARVAYIGAVLVGGGLAWIDDLSLKEKAER